MLHPQLSLPTLPSISVVYLKTKQKKGFIDAEEFYECMKELAPNTSRIQVQVRACQSHRREGKERSHIVAKLRYANQN